MSPRLDMGALTRLVLATLWAVGAWAGAHLGSEHLEGAARLGVRWVCGAGLMYTGVEAALALTRVLYGLVGIDLRPLHDDPIRSRTISEFWNRRWNRIVHGFLKQNVFEPVARRGHGWWGGCWSSWRYQASSPLFVEPMMRIVDTWG